MKDEDITKEQFHSLVRNIPGIVYRCACDDNWTMQYISDFIEVISGYPPSDFIDNRVRTYKSIMYPDDPQISDKIALGAIEHKEPFELEYRIINADGTIRWVCEKGRGVYGDDGQVLYLDGVIFDNTERKQIEETLRISKESYKTVADYAYDWEAWLSPDENYLYVSPSCERISGYTAEMFMSDPQLLHDIIHTEDKDRVKEHYFRCKEDCGAEQIDFRIKTKSGDERWISHYCQSVYSVDGTYLGRRESNRDITQQRQLEEQLRQSQKMETIRIMSGGIAHDFNNILGIMLSNITLAKDDIDKPEDALKFMGNAEKALFVARDLVDYFLNISGSSVVHSETTAPCELIKNTTTVVFKGYPITPEYSFSEDMWDMKIAPEQLKQIIVNVVNNSCEAMTDGGVLKINTEPITYKDEDESNKIPLSDGRYFKLCFSDNGCGISKNDLPKIFDPYYSTKTRGVQKGMGLGLSVAYSILSKLNGYIRVESEESVGTDVFIYIPIAQKSAISEEPKKEAKAAGVEVSVGVKRILFMDDEKSLQSSTKMLLERVGYEVEVASNGEEAIQKYVQAQDSSKPFDAVILDLTIVGGMGGAETIKKLIEIDPKVNGIVSSGYSSDPVISNYGSYGFKGSLAKPTTRADLVEALENLS